MDTAFATEGSDTTVTCVGNVYTYVDLDGTHLTSSFSLTGYQGCGECGVGSRVVEQYSAFNTAFRADGTTIMTFIVVYDELFIRRS